VVDRASEVFGCECTARDLGDAGAGKEIWHRLRPRRLTHGTWASGECFEARVEQVLLDAHVALTPIRGGQQLDRPLRMSFGEQRVCVGKYPRWIVRRAKARRTPQIESSRSSAWIRASHAFSMGCSRSGPHPRDGLIFEESALDVLKGVIRFHP
jgi:hypothetical protein